MAGIQGVEPVLWAVSRRSRLFLGPSAVGLHWLPPLATAEPCMIRNPSSIQAGLDLCYDPVCEKKGRSSSPLYLTSFSARLEARSYRHSAPIIRRSARSASSLPARLSKGDLDHKPGGSIGDPSGFSLTAPFRTCAVVGGPSLVPVVQWPSAVVAPWCFWGETVSIAAVTRVSAIVTAGVAF